eukprot:374761-Alexandrium_andersonii.AAC.1
MRSNALLWSARTRAGHSASGEALRGERSWATWDAASPRTACHRPPCGSAQVGGSGPALRWRRASRMLGPQHPPRTAAWSG